MTRFLVLADVHGRIEELSKLVDYMTTEKFDAILSPGDFTDMFDIPEGFQQIDIAEIVIQKLLSLGKPIFCVPGNHDPYEIVDMFHEYGVNVHASVKKFKGMYIIGFGGAITPFNTKFEPTEDEIKESLENTCNKAKEPFALMTHMPPYNTNLDKAEGGKHVGSKAIKGFILKRKPIFSVSAHIHESAGIDVIGKTHAIYPGVSYNGYYGIVSVMNGNVVCEIKKAEI